MGTTAPVCHSTGTVPDLHATMKRCVSQDNATNDQRAPWARCLLSIPRALMQSSFLTTSVTSAMDMVEASPKSLGSASFIEGMLVWLRSSSRCSYPAHLYPQLPTNIPGSTQHEQPCFPALHFVGFFYH